MPQERKTVGDYLMDGGLKDKYFISEFGLSEYKEIIYQIKKLRESMNKLHVIVFGVQDKPLAFHLNDKEATPEEVQRAKESSLYSQGAYVRQLRTKESALTKA